eukprot:maker-scaffold1347_size46067-snap-gene-0.11 protein:Tk02970 transcript:maker-scaffold1347_size46067-snap-gene-0.11-mRNA-1 annotation:"neuronal acetylcholine receptor subunit alpha-3 precursor"
MQALLLVSIALASGIQAFPDRASATTKLREGLLSNYDEATQPSSTSLNGVTQVDFGLNALWLELDDRGILCGSVWLKMKWNDERLSWNANNVTGIPENFHVAPSQIWTPDISLFNRFDSGAPMFPEKTKGFSGNSIVMANGDVILIPSVGIQAICEDVNLADRWGEQNCTLKYGSWTYSGYKLDMGMYDGHDQVDLSMYQKSSPLEIKSSKVVRREKTYDCCPEPYISMEIHLTVQRRFVQTPRGLFRNPHLGVSGSTLSTLKAFSSLNKMTVLAAGLCFKKFRIRFARSSRLALED